MLKFNFQDFMLKLEKVLVKRHCFAKGPPYADMGPAFVTISSYSHAACPAKSFSKLRHAERYTF